MQQLEMDFFDTYKRLDLICRDMYPSEDPERQGVKAYLTAMDTNAYSGRNLVRNWDSAYHTLQHLRMVRNQIGHERYSECTPADLDALNAFYEDILTQQDPLALLETARRIRTHKQQAHQNTSGFDARTQQRPQSAPKFDEADKHSHGDRVAVMILLIVLIAFFVVSLGYLLK